MQLLPALSLSHKAAIGLIVAVLSAGAAVGAFAAHGDLPGQAQGHGPVAAATAHADKTPMPEGTQRAIKGIPTDNPKHQPEADGTCVPGETVVKTVTSGVQVNVPCQSIDHTPGAEAMHAVDRKPGSEATEHMQDGTPGPGTHDDRGIAERTAHAGADN